MAYLPLVLLMLVALFSSATVVSFIIALRSSREHHNTIFPMVREVEGIKARQARVAMAVFLVLSAITIGGWVATQKIPLYTWAPKTTDEQASLSQPLISDTQDIKPVLEKTALINGEVTEPPVDGHNVEIPTNTPDPGSSVNGAVVVLATDTPAIETPTLEPTATPTPIPTTTPTPVPSPTIPPTSTPTPPPTATFTPIPEATPKPAEPEQPAKPTETIDVTPAPSVSVKEVSTLVPPSGITIGPIIFAANITDRYEAIDPRVVFDAPPEKIYAVFPYRGMQNGLPLLIIWYYQGQELVRDEYEWRWGRTGRFHAFVNRPATGKYKIEIKIGSGTMASGNFEVIP